MMTRKIAFALVLAIGSSTALSAQVTAPVPDGRLLRLGSDTLYIVVSMQGQSRRSGMVVDRLDTATISGERVVRRVYTTTDAVLGNRVDTLIDELRSLRPRSVRSRSNQGTEFVDWRDGRVRGTASAAGQPQRNVDEDVRGVVYGTASVDLILRSSPLADGYSVSIDAYSALQGQVRVTARVTTSEAVEGAGDAWRVDAAFGDVSVSFWISKSSRKLVRQVMHIAPGAGLRFELRG